MIETMSDAKKVVRQRYPFAVSVKVAQFYGWAILIAKGANMALVQTQRSEESAWIAAATIIKEKGA